MAVSLDRPFMQLLKFLQHQFMPDLLLLWCTAAVK